MSSPFFRFKQFTVWHDRCAMKVGTDGVLLGAWCPLPNSAASNSPQGVLYPRILDIGTGSGLIALMLAQRLSSQSPIANNLYTIDAIDIDADAVAQAQYNFEQSPWSFHLHAHHSTLQNWSPSLQRSDLQVKRSSSVAIFKRSNLYSLIVSNPPYFQDSLKNPNAQRATARHTDTLSYAELIAHSARLLQEDGILALVLPIEAEQEILKLATEHGLHPVHITYVHSKPGKPAKRLLIALSPISNNQYPITNSEASNTQYPIADTMYIESENAPRSDEYKELTKDFYL